MDNNKRVLLAVALSLMVLLTWNYFYPPVTPLTPADNQTISQPNQTVPQPMAAPVAAPATA